MEINPTRMCELLVGLPEVTVLGCGSTGRRDCCGSTSSPGCHGPTCRGCGTAAEVKDRPEVTLVDLPGVRAPGPAGVAQASLGVPARHGCPVGSWTVEDPDHRCAPAGADRSGGPVGDGTGGPLGSHGERGGRRVGLRLAHRERRRHRLRRRAGRRPGSDRSAHRLGLGRDPVRAGGISTTPTAVVDVDRRCRSRGAVGCRPW